MHRLLLVFAVIFSASVATAAEVTDATGRTVAVPDHIQHILPAGPPAAVLIAAIAPNRMIGFPAAVSNDSRTLLAQAATDLPPVPRLTANEDQTAAVQALHPDLVIDYGTVSPRYTKLAAETQQKTGIPTLLFDGSLDQIPTVARTLGRILGETERAETLARVAEAILALPLPAGPYPKVFYARGGDGLMAAAPGTDVTGVFARLGWQVVAPAGTGTFRHTDIETVRKLDPDVIILASPEARSELSSPAWASLRAVKAGHAYIAPSEPFGWIEEPPSINRLLGIAWLRGGDPFSLAALFNASVYGHALTQAQLQEVAGNTPSFQH